MRRRIPSRVGRRGIFLLLIGAVWILNGMSLVLEPPPAFGAGQRLVIQYFLPITTWGWTFVVGGILSVIYAFRRKNDYPGFVGAIVPCVFWGSSEIISFILGTFDRGLIASFVWVLVTCIILLIAGWSEAEPPLEVNGEVDGG